MKNYVLASRDFGTNKMYYYTGMDNGAYSFSTVDQAKRFELNELFDLLKNNSTLSFLGFSVIRIEDCTFELIYEDKNNLRFEYSLPERVVR